MPAAVHLKLLGGFSISVDGVPKALRWPGRRAAELVQLLALAPGHQLLRDQVIDALWPHLDAEAGAANLRKAAHFARQGLADPGAVVLRGGQVALLPEARITTDVEEFVAAADSALAAGDHELATAAADRYGGELLPTARYEDWADELRRRLHEQFLAVLRLAGAWSRLADADPTDEHAARELMRAALAAGRRHEGIARFARLRDALARELGVRPDAETSALYRLCVEGVGPVSPGFVGRDVEAAGVAVALRRPGRPAFVAVRGPAGIGKSAFVHRVAADAERDGWRTVVVTPRDAGRSYAALGAAVDELVLARRDLLARLADKTRSVLSQIASSVPPGPALEAPITRHQVTGALHRLLAATAGTAGTFVVVDDAHRADAATIDALLHLGDSESGRIAVLLAYRAESAPDLLRQGVAQRAKAPWVTVLDLAPLSHDDITSLVRATGFVVDAADLGTLAAQSEGNPFFALQLAHRAAHPGNPRPGVDSDLITSRFADLDESMVAMLRRLSLIDEDLHLTDVLALTGATEAGAAALLDAALAAGTLVVSDGRYRFAHELVRLALAQPLAPHQRVAVHREAASRLARAGAAPSVVARHWLAGDRPAEAAPLLLEAARDAMRLGGYTTALDHLDTLLLHEPTNAAALLLRAKALDALGDIRALSAYAAAVDASDDAARQEIIPHQALAQIKLGDPAGALVTLGDSRPTSLDARVARALTLSGAAALGFGDPAVGSAEAAEARKLAFASGDASAITIASWAQAAAAHARGEQRANLFSELMDTHALPKLAVTVFDGQLCINQRLLYGARPYPDVIAWADSFAAEATRLGAARGYAFAVTLRGEASLLAGDLDRADADLREAYRLHREMNGTTGESFSLQRRAEVALARGRFDEARSLLDDALDVARESDVGFHLLDRIYGTRIALALAAAPDAVGAVLAEAEEAVRGPVETCPGCRITLAFPAALAAAHTGDADRLAEYERACTFLADVVMRLPAWDAALVEVRAHQRLLAGDRAGAQELFAEAARGYAAAGQPGDVRRCESAVRG